MSVKATIQRFTNNFKAIASVVPHLNKIVKSKSEDEIFEALIDSVKFEQFMDEVYSKLPTHVKLKVSKDQLIPIIEQTKTELLKKKKFKKKLEFYQQK